MIHRSMFYPDFWGPPQDLPFFDLAREAREFVYVLRCYSLMFGSDVAVWRRRSEFVFDRIAYATGAICRTNSPPEVWAKVRRDDETSLPRIERIRRELARLALIEPNVHEWGDAACRREFPLIDTKSACSAEDFGAICHLATRLDTLVSQPGDGRSLILGDHTPPVRVVAKFHGLLIDVTNCERTGDWKATVKAADEIVQKSGLGDYSVRDFD